MSNNFFFIKIYCYVKTKNIILIHRICLYFYIIPVSLYTIFPQFWKFEYSLAVELHSSCPKTLTHSCLQCLVRRVDGLASDSSQNHRDGYWRVPDQDCTESEGEFPTPCAKFFRRSNFMVFSQ